MWPEHHLSSASGSASSQTQERAEGSYTIVAVFPQIWYFNSAVTPDFTQHWSQVPPWWCVVKQKVVLAVAVLFSWWLCARGNVILVRGGECFPEILEFTGWFMLYLVLTNNNDIDQDMTKMVGMEISTALYVSWPDSWVKPRWPLKQCLQFDFFCTILHNPTEQLKNVSITYGDYFLEVID